MKLSENHHQQKNQILILRKIQALATRIQTGDVQAILAKMETHWKAIFPEKEFNYYFLDEDFNEQFISIERS